MEENEMDCDESVDEEEDDDLEEDSEEEDEGEENGEESEPKSRPRVYLPNKPLQDGEVLECDESVYLMRHEGKAGYTLFS